MKTFFSSKTYLCLIFVVSLTLSVEAQTDRKVVWKKIDTLSIPVPPDGHPRLYVDADDVTQMKQRLEHPVLQHVVKKLHDQSERTLQFKIEWDALQYLASQDRVLGRVTIDSTLALLKRTVLPDKHDAARETGRMMVTGAIVYDWTYPLLTGAEKQVFIQELIRLAKTLECDYPPTKQGSVTGHSSESFIMRDMLSAGIAIYDEYPEMYELAAARFFREHLPARNWLYRGHAYHQGDSYGPLRYSWDTYPLMIYGKMGIDNIYNPDQRFVPHFYTYVTRPDGQRLRAGDTYNHSAPRGRPWNPYVGTLFTASYYKDGVLLEQYLRQGQSDGNENIFQFLWWDVNLQPKPLNSLPLSKYFDAPFGWMVARTGWDKDAVIAEMKINVYNFNNHQHLDAGAFQIYHKGSLATVSGIYQGTSGGYGSPHDKNYQWRSIANNTLLVYDPSEKFSQRGDYGNDGGQRLPNNRSEPRTLDVLLDPQNGYQTGEVIAHGFGPDLQTPDYTYLKGDITKAYSAKVDAVKRSFVFLNLRNSQVAAALIVYDKVVSTDPSFRKYWLLHSIEAPVVNGNKVTIIRTENGDTGKLVNTTLLPASDNSAIVPVGGPGKEFWVFGKNYGSEPNYKRENSYERAAWRVEVSPTKPAREDYFLNVMQVMERDDEALKVGKIEGDKVVGVMIADRVVAFSKDSEVVDSPATFSIKGKGTYKVLVTDVEPGTWQVLKDKKVVIRSLSVKEGDGLLYFEGTEGVYTIKR